MARSSIFLAVAALAATVSAADGATPSNPALAPVDSCAYACLDQFLSTSALSSCSANNTACQCNAYNMITAVRNCLVSTNDCTNNRYDAITFLQTTCDNALYAAAVASAGSGASASVATATPQGTGTVVVSASPSTVVVSSEPTDLASAEAALQAANPGVQFVSTGNVGGGNSNGNSQNTNSGGAVQTVGTKYQKLSGQAIAGIAFGTIVGACLIFMGAFLCLESRKKKARRAAEAAEEGLPSKYTGDPKPPRNKKWFKKWFQKKTPSVRSRSIDEDEEEKEAWYGTTLDTKPKEMNLVVDTSPMVVVPIPGARSRVSMITTDLQEQYNRNISPSPEPRPPMPVVYESNFPSESPQRTSPPRMSLTYATKPQRPAVTIDNPVIVFPQATVNEYSESARNSAVSLNASNLQPSGPGFHMNIIPATPQMNGTSPISPAANKDEIFNYYAQEQQQQQQQNQSVGMASTTEGNEKRYTYQQHASTTSDASQRSGPPPYQVGDHKRAARPYQTSEQPAAGLIMPHRTRSSSRSPSPSQTHQGHQHNLSTSTTSTSIFDNDSSSQSATPSGNKSSQAWRASVERAADRAMDRVRHSRCEDVQEDEEHQVLTRTADGIVTESSDGKGSVDSRGRSKWRASLQDMLIPSTGVAPAAAATATTTNSDHSSRSMSVSPAPSTRSRSRSGSEISGRSGSIGPSRDSASSKRAMERRQSRRNSGAVMMV